MPPHPRNVRHALAPDWPGPLCNNGVDPARKRITGVPSTGTRVTCAHCREILAGEDGPWTMRAARLAKGAP
jgi:hypothetical protein